MSTAKAEYVSLSAYCAQVIWMRTQLLDYGYRYNKIPMYCDSKSVIAISCNPVQHSRTKQINIRYHFIKEHVERVFHMAQQIFLAAQLVPKFQDIRRCNNYVVLQTVYLQQFWKTVSKVPDTKDTIKFKLDTQEIIYTVEMLCDTLHLPGIVDKVSAFYMKFLAQLWQTMFKDFVNCVFQKKNVIQYPRFTKLIIAYLMKKYPSISSRLEEDYHSIKYDIPFVSVYITRNVTVRGMLIPDAFLTDEICAIDDYKETTPRAYKTPTLDVTSPQGKKRKQSDKETSSPSKSLKVTIKQKHVVKGGQDDESYASKFVASMLNNDDDDSGNRLKPGSHKENPKVIHNDDDDDNKAEKKDEKKDDEMGSLEIMTEKMMWRRKGYMIKNMERKCVTIDEFWKVHQKVDQVLHKIVPQLAERATNDLIESNLKPMVADTIIQDRDAFQSQVLALISNEFDAQAPNIIEELFKNYVQNNVIQVHPTISMSTDTNSSADLQQQLYLKMKRSLQDQANDP
ncbi:hypothetical protein Tco_0875901 [Tanacetum coccineum]|uniref:Uncharacterized protein n=1 Tax=Tanacetum coccineum TaxID=301880 RepID=A0ABQ5BQX4_9ASTR